MEAIHIRTAAGSLKKNFPLLLSTGAALCLFLSPSLFSVALAACLFLLTAMLAMLGLTEVRAAGPFPALLAAAMAILGEWNFITTWLPSGKAASLAGAVGLSVPVLLGLLGAGICGAGAFAMYRLSGCAIAGAKQLCREKLPEQRPDVMKANLKRNWFFPLSALAFFFLNTTFQWEYYAGMLFPAAAALLAATQSSSLAAGKKPLQLLSALTATGICWAVQASAAGLPPVLRLTAAAAGVYAVCVCVLRFWEKLLEITKETRLFADLTSAELWTYGVLLAVLTVFMALSFARSAAFYGTDQHFDLIYTSDSPLLVKSNAYLLLTNGQNDLRQPLFAVFAAPFLGLPWLLGLPFGPAVQAIFLNAAQIAMLLAANFLLAKLLELRSGQRIPFMLLTACTYMTLLFSLMMEQYIVAYFWLILCLYLMQQRQSSRQLALWGAGGSLLTSMVLLPFVSDRDPFKDFRKWFTDALVCGLGFGALMLAFCRFDVLYNVVGRMSFLTQFTGESLTMADKIFQYTVFVSACFAAPAAAVQPNLYGIVSWQLTRATGICLTGAGIFLLCILSAGLNWRKSSSRMAAGWVVFSLVMLLGLGWGTQENGLILYALYFGWAFLVLLVQLVQRLEEKLRIRWLLPAASLAGAGLLLAVNIPGLLALLRFAVTHYPA